MSSLEKSILIKQILSMILGIGGIFIVWHFSNWKVAAGVFLMLWGSNLEISIRLNNILIIIKNFIKEK